MSRVAWSLLGVLLISACATEEATEPVRDAGPADTGLRVTDTGPRDAGVDVPRDVGFDAGPRDVGFDIGFDTGPRDTGNDVGFDTGPRDTGNDVGFDTGPRDAGQSVPLPRDVQSGAQCRALLTQLGVTWTSAGATMGIVDPIYVSSPVNGVNFRYSSYTASAGRMLMDCRLGVALWHLTNALRTRWNITDVVHLGVYNYRTISGSTMLSQHAYATAIDLNNFRTAAGLTHSVTTEFVANGRPTCPPRATNPKDQLLKEIACWMYDSGVFHIILTPNYNSAHRDHYHVDLTPGSQFIGVEIPGGIDPEPSPWLDWYLDDH
ncbi:MAG: extensin family protein [Myxococcales bacterium]|nr:extensin family protein [Myxococcales bacterium]